MEICIKNGIPCITSPLFEKYGIAHAFTTKRGGCSEGAFDSLNVSTRRKNGALPYGQGLFSYDFLCCF